MSITGKMNAGMAGFARSMKTGTANRRLDGKIAEQEKRIKILTKEIGNLALVRLGEGDTMSPEIMERYSAIQKAREEIVGLEKEKSVSNAKCPSCGVKTAVDMKYCGKCGAVMSEA
jgi:ribosomal protein S27AE